MHGGTAALQQPLLPKTRSGKDSGGSFSAGSVAASVVLLCSASIGTGVLALPYGVSVVGIIPGMMLFGLASTAAYTSNVIICRCVHKTGKGSYGELMTAILGQSGATVLDAFVVLEGIGACATYLVFIMDYVPQVCALGGDIWCTDRTNVLIAASIFVWPLCCLKGLSALRFTSSCSITAILFTSVVVIAKAPGLFAKHGRALSEVVTEVHVGMDGFQVFAMACFAFMTHSNTPEIAFRLKRPSTRRFALVVGLETVLLCGIYFGIAACGYVSFLGDIQQDFLTNYALRDFCVVICRSMLSMTLVFACPINVFPAVQALFNIIELCRGDKGRDHTLLYDKDAVRIPVATACFAIALGVAMKTPHVADLISVVCVWTTSPLMFMFPALMYWRLLGQRDMAMPLALIGLTVALWLAEIVRLMQI